MSNEPVAVIIGDSISMGYTPRVREALAGKVRVVRPEGNGGTSSNVRAHLGEWLEGIEPDAIHFNAGLHDLARDEGEQGPNRVPIEQYEANLRAIVAWLKANTAAALIWATTTPVLDDWHAARKGFIRKQADVEAYNRVALEVMRAEGVAVDDLHAVIEAAGREACLKEDGVHMLDAGNERLAAAVVRTLTEALGV